MKQLILLFLLITICNFTNAQIFRQNDQVQVDTLLIEDKEGKWQNAVVLTLDTVAKTYSVKLANGDRIKIPYRNPELWIRPVTNLPGPGIYGPSGRFDYQNRSRLLTAFDCRPSERFIKKNIWIHLAWEFPQFHALAVDFTSFKGQHGYDDKKVKNQQVFPFKIEMLVHFKRIIKVRGKEFTEYQTWEFDRVYEYATRPEKKCHFSLVPSSEAKLLFSGWY